MGFTYENNWDAFEILILLGILGLMLLAQILYILTLSNTLKLISADNRTMSPGKVWLLMIPLFSIIWSFIVVNNLSNSIYKEAKVKDFTLHEANPANGIGIAMCVLSCLTIIPVLGSLASLASVICWIIYWSKISSYKKAIALAPPKHPDGDSLIFNY